MNRFSGDRDATWFYFNLQKMVRSPQVRKKLAKIEASFREHSDPSLFTDEILKIAGELEQEGKCSPLSLISEEHVDEMYRYMAARKWIDRDRKELGEFGLDNVPEDTQLAHLPLMDVLRAPHLLKLANQPSILLAIEKQFGCKPCAEVIQASWSPPSKKDAIRSQLFHRDTDGLQFIKLFLFLTEVTEDSGPHCYVLNSHDSNKLTKPGFYTEEQVVESFGEENITFISCPKGTHFLENTYGVHKGTKPTGRGRLMIQILYCSHPTIYPPKEPVLTEDDLKTLGVENLDKYVFRKFVK